VWTCLLKNDINVGKAVKEGCIKVSLPLFQLNVHRLGNQYFQEGLELSYPLFEIYSAEGTKDVKEKAVNILRIIDQLLRCLA